jgi:hypothetical protein
VHSAREGRKMLHPVGETVDKHRANYGVEQGTLVPIMRGVLITLPTTRALFCLCTPCELPAFLPKYLSVGRERRTPGTHIGRSPVSKRATWPAHKAAKPRTHSNPRAGLPGNRTGNHHRRDR